MKRAIWSIVFASATVLSFAQGSFTIVRPFDGSKVREIARVLMPKNSIPDAGYVGVFLNGNFREAIAPRLSKDGKYYEYPLDTKDLEDGTYQLELKLYVDYSSQPRVVDTSSIEIVVANKASIPIPEDGLSLRYGFKTGQERIYRVQNRTITNVISEKDQKNSSRPFQISQDGESFKMLYACDNAYGNGEGLIRMQIVPDKGIQNREYSYITTSQSDSPAKYYPEDMSSVYMKLTPTGRELFGVVPSYFALEGGEVSGGSRTRLYATFPLPVLPSKTVTPGSSWQSTIQEGALDLNNLYELKSVVENIPARGEFIGVEWEMGHPCAKIKNSIAQGTPTRRTEKGSEAISNRKVSIEETIWFALDTRQVIKFFRDITQEGQIDLGPLSGGPSGGGPTGGPPGGPTSGGPRGGPGGRGGGRGSDDFRMTPYGNNIKALQQPRGSGGPRGGGPRGGPGGPQGGPGGPGGMGPGGPGGSGAQSNMGFVRIRNQRLFVLEQ